MAFQSCTSSNTQQYEREHSGKELEGKKAGGGPSTNGQRCRCKLDSKQDSKQG